MRLLKEVITIFFKGVWFIFSAMVTLGAIFSPMLIGEYGFMRGISYMLVWGFVVAIIFVINKNYKVI